MVGLHMHTLKEEELLLWTNNFNPLKTHLIKAVYCYTTKVLKKL